MNWHITLLSSILLGLYPAHALSQYNNIISLSSNIEQAGQTKPLALGTPYSIVLFLEPLSALLVDKYAILKKASSQSPFLLFKNKHYAEITLQDATVGGTVSSGNPIDFQWGYEWASEENINDIENCYAAELSDQYTQGCIQSVLERYLNEENTDSMQYESDLENDHAQVAD